MSISYVVPVWREDVYQRVAHPWIADQVNRFGGELIEVRGSRSIFEALERGRQKAKNRFIAYVHDDVKMLTETNLRKQVRQTFNEFPKLALLGPAGKVEKVRVPWWLNPGLYVGHWCRRGNRNQVVYQYGDQKGNAPYRDVIGDPYQYWRQSTQRWDRFAKAGLVDGFYLIEDTRRLNEPWDCETYGENWHGYDVDRCYHAHSLGLDVMVSPWLFMHDNAGHAGYKGTNPATIHGTDQANRQINSEGDALWLADLDVVNQKVRAKWGVA